jgi:adenosylcobyric acid synthase
MLAGTGSDVGKSVIAAALCRIFLQDGYHPAPFKAQNMALNSYATPDGQEIGRAQAVQAEAAGLPCHTDMNPLLLKPQSDHTCQVVLNGRPIGNRDAYDFWKPTPAPSQGEGSAEGFDNGKSGVSPSLVQQRPATIDFRAEVCAAYDRLASRYNPIVMEGAGSISELNLRHHDLVNLPMARHAQADVILVADIDRGGVFASAYGSIVLQTPDDRQLIKGIIINKFRGDMRLFDEGRRMLQQLCGVPVLGVIPYFSDIHIDDEDSVALSRRASLPIDPKEGKVNVAVVRLAHISNYTDFDALEHDPRLHLYYSANPEHIAQADIIILPGTKTTIADLQQLFDNGCAKAVVEAHAQGKTVLGICGGYQMMGREVLDPLHTEGNTERTAGLGLLPVVTTMSGEKTTRQVEFTLHRAQGTAADDPLPMRGYEIHMGRTQPVEGAPSKPLLTLADAHTDGYIESPRCMGTYVHGILDNAPFVNFLLQPFASRLTAAAPTTDYRTYRQQQFDRLADHVRQHLDMHQLYQILTDND